MEETKSKKHEQLADSVIEKIGHPLDKWAVAATLESLGLRDVDANEEFDKEDIFELAEDIYARCRARERGPLKREKLEELSFRERLRRFARFYLQGLFFALPMAGQIFAVLFLGYSLWASFRFTEREGTVVAVGTILSLFVTGGFVQAIARKGLFYLEQGNYLLAREICLRFIRIGTLVVIEVGLLFYSLSLVVPFFGRLMFPVALVYYFLLSELWLSLAVLYTLKERVAILALTLLGAFLVYLLTRLAPQELFLAHWIGLTVTDVLVFAWGYRVLSKRLALAGKRARLARLPRPSIVAYSVAPYFAYGMLYFAYLFADRLVAWSLGPKPPIYFIWFKTSYEWGLDWALISLILSVAALEYTIHEFAKLIIPVQKLFDAFHIPEHNLFFKWFYRRQAVLLFVAAALSTAVAYLMALLLPRFMGLGNIMENEIIRLVFFGGVVGYNLLAWGLLNGVFLFSLSRPRFILRAISFALLVNLVAGIAFSRMVGYEYSVLGLVIGSLAFGIVTTFYAFRVLDRLDYYYYSAY